MSPLLFSLLTSVIIQQLQVAASPVRVLVYADDGILIFSRSPCHAIGQLHRCLSASRQFAYYTGLNDNFAKSYLILKDEWTSEQKLLLARTSMQVNDSAKYLGVNFGEVTPQQAFAPAIQKAMLWAPAMQRWDIALAKRPALLELWVLPLVSLPARVVFTYKAAIASLQSLYHTALHTTPYGITLPKRSHDKDSGGFSLLTPKTFLLWQLASTFVNFKYGDTALPPTVTNPFLEWASHWGVPLGPSNLSTLQRGQLPYATMPLLALSAKS